MGVNFTQLYAQDVPTAPTVTPSIYGSSLQGGVQSPITDPTKSFSNNTQVEMVGSGIQLAGTVAGGAIQAGATRKAGERAMASNMSGLDDQEADIRAEQAMARKQRALQDEMDTYRRMNENIGLRVTAFQRDLANKLKKYNDTLTFADKLRTTGERNQQIQDVNIAQMGEL